MVDVIVSLSNYTSNHCPILFFAQVIAGNNRKL